MKTSTIQSNSFLTLFLFTVILLSFSCPAVAQHVIGSTDVNSSGLLEFGQEPRGILFSPVEDVTALGPDATVNLVAGTVAFDGATGSFRYFNGTSWSTVVQGGVTGSILSGTDSDQQLIGATMSSADGVLILGTDTGETRALILPRIANGWMKLDKVSMGLTYYDTECGAVMVYNGTTWTKF